MRSARAKRTLLQTPLGSVSPLLTGSLSAKAVWRFHTVFDGGTFSDSGVSANFDVHRSYEWPIIRPRSAADAAHPGDVTPINTVAEIGIFDTVTNATVPLSDSTEFAASSDTPIW